MVSTRYSLVDKTYIHTTPVTQSRRPVLFVQYNWTSFKGVILIYWRCTILRWNFQGLTEECPIVTVRALNSHEIYYRILGLYFENSTSHDRISRFEIFLDWEPWTVRYKPKRTFYPEIRPNLLVNCKISTLFQAIKSPKVLGILRLRNTRIILLNVPSYVRSRVLTDSPVLRPTLSASVWRIRESKGFSRRCSRKSRFSRSAGHLLRENTGSLRLWENENLLYL